MASTSETSVILNKSKEEATCFEKKQQPLPPKKLKKITAVPSLPICSRNRTKVKKEKWKSTEYKDLIGKKKKKYNVAVTRCIKYLKLQNCRTVLVAGLLIVSKVYCFGLLKWRKPAMRELLLSVPSLPSRIPANPDGFPILPFSYITAILKII